MSNLLLPFLSLAPYHILVYGTLLGTELYQSFVMTGISFRALPMSMFTTLQRRVFPAYFRLQTLLILATGLTYPPASLFGLTRHWSRGIPLLLTLVTATLNLTVYGPRTQHIMMERIHQETRDDRKYNDRDNQSQEMKQINQRFSRTHAMSIHLNLIAIIGTVWYGLVLGGRLNVLV